MARETIATLEAENKCLEDRLSSAVTKHTEARGRELEWETRSKNLEKKISDMGQVAFSLQTQIVFLEKKTSELDGYIRRVREVETGIAESSSIQDFSRET